MKFSQNQLILAGMIIGIIVLGSILAWILFNQEDSGIGISLPKAFAQELHDGLQTELELNQAL
ncbi:hypothetical protein KKE06_00440, partial [Candidatus Micrarchaeota archaeon]|nr:hypothetical protein [Candidatus Micrarchaeota archaeon]MBU1929997.1 hypothetical protein [Candidatus Micrarchaeota archaeon]